MKTKNILVIDDNEIVCNLISKLSRKHNAQVTIARTGEEARQALDVLKDDQKLDAIFLDMILPFMSGWDVLTVIKNTHAIKNTPVVVVTGVSLSKEEMLRLKDQVVSFIDKRTFTIEEFERVFEKVVGGGGRGKDATSPLTFQMLDPNQQKNKQRKGWILEGKRCKIAICHP